jgi:uncharacterized membrane protein YgcG
MRIIIKASIAIIVTLYTSCGSSTLEKSTAGESLRMEHRIFDYANLLSTPQSDSVFNLIKNLESKIGSQIAVLTFDNLNGEKIEEYSFKMADSLRLGRATHNDGILITIALVERRARIEVGLGLENIIKDEIAARILREHMSPKFQEGKFGQGIYSGVDEICKLIVANESLVGQDPK